jgi:hypothetical protein
MVMFFSFILFPVWFVKIKELAHTQYYTSFERTILNFGLWVVEICIYGLHIKYWYYLDSLSFACQNKNYKKVWKIRGDISTKLNKLILYF